MKNTVGLEDKTIPENKAKRPKDKRNRKQERKDRGTISKEQEFQKEQIKWKVGTYNEIIFIFFLVERTGVFRFKRAY